MKIFTITATAFVLILTVGSANAGQGEICYSNAVLIGQSGPLTNDTTFACPSLGEVTIPEIYQLGWRVSQLDLRSVGGDVNDPLSVEVAWMALIEMI